MGVVGVVWSSGGSRSDVVEVVGVVEVVDVVGVVEVVG